MGGASSLIEPSYDTRCDREIEMTSILQRPEVEPAASDQHVQPTSRLETDTVYSRLELNLNVSGLGPVSIDHGPEPTPAEWDQKIAPQVLIGTESKEVIEGNFSAGPIVKKTSEYTLRKKSRTRLAVASILLVVLITTTVLVSVKHIQNRSR